MTDDLVKRLHKAVAQFYGTHPCGLLAEAADRIEELEAALKQAQMQLHSEKLLRNDLEETFSIRSQKQYQRIEWLEKLFLSELGFICMKCTGEER